MDWEDANKIAFCQLVQTWLVKSTAITEERAMNVLFAAHRCKKATIPTFLPQAVFDFVHWQISGGGDDDSKPDWVRTPLDGGWGAGIA